MSLQTTRSLRPIGFVHEPLDTTLQSIRVLKVLPSNKRRIECALRHQLLAEDGHVCLSYMWGPESPVKTIRVNGCSFQIRHNLWRCLRTARRLKELVDVWLWIDAICIDQQNVAERNHQVQQMAEIYAKARKVVVWPEPIPSMPSGISSFSVPVRSAYWGLATAYSVSTDIVETEALFDSKYWNRLWILQELFLAKQLEVVVSERILSWRDFTDLLNRYLHYNKNLSRRLMPVHAITSGLQISKGEYPFRLSTILAVGRGRECSDVRDQFYALLGLLSRKFHVDYSISAAELAVNVATHFYHGSTLDEFRSIRSLLESLKLNCKTSRVRYEYPRTRYDVTGPSCPPYPTTLHLFLYNKHEVALRDTSWNALRCSSCDWDFERSSSVSRIVSVKRTAATSLLVFYSD